MFDKRFIWCLGLATSLLFIQSSDLAAQQWTVANDQFSVFPSPDGDVIVRPSFLAAAAGNPGAPLPFPAQSFTPDNQGSGSSGTPPADGPVVLTEFTMGAMDGNAWVFSAPYAGTFQQLVDQTIDAADSANLLGISTSGSAGTYSFAGGLALPGLDDDVFVYLDVRADPAFFGNFGAPDPLTNPPEPPFTDIYTGGTALAANEPILQLEVFVDAEPIPVFDVADWEFSATLVPEPSSTVLWSLLVIGLTPWWRRRRGINR